MARGSIPASAFNAARGKRKYGNTPTILDGIRFDSVAEANRWSVLRILERTGHISELKRQVPFGLVVNGVKIGTYKADFAYNDNRTGSQVVEDVKSEATMTDVYRLKKKLMLALHGIEIVEIIKGR